MKRYWLALVPILAGFGIRAFAVLGHRNECRLGEVREWTVLEVDGMPAGRTHPGEKRCLNRLSVASWRASNMGAEDEKPSVFNYERVH